MPKKTIKETSQSIGKAIARSTHQIESTGKKAQNAVDTVSKKAKNILSHIGQSKKNTPPPVCPFKINKGNSLEGQIGETAGVVYEYLLKNKTVPTSKLVNAIMRKKHTKANVHAAMGWLMREAKLDFTEDGTMIKLR